ncbi:MAG: hypothetical protein Q9190_003104 [Brigantiaea leucoxantha]
MSRRPPLQGIRVVELAGLAPAPFASLLLADYGASVLRIDRPHPLAYTSTALPPTVDTLSRRKSSIALDLRRPAATALLKSVLQHADVFIDPYRPGVLEALSLAPSDLLILNPRLIIARLTGFRRSGPYGSMAGHDINYLAVSGILSQLGRAGALPYAPANILADFAGGGLVCAFGILLALFERCRTGNGQVVENNMVDGAAYLGTMMRYGIKTPLWNQPRGENLLDGGCPWYEVYACKDGGCMAVGALEERFFKELIRGLGVETIVEGMREDKHKWPELRRMFQEKFLEKNRQDWERIFAGKDACCTPVLGQKELEEAGYEQMLPVRLLVSPGREIERQNGWTSTGLAPTVGGEQILREWMGWRQGKEYQAEQGTLLKIDVAKL